MSVDELYDGNNGLIDVVTVVLLMGLMVSLTAMSAFFSSSSRVKMGVFAKCPVVGAAIGENWRV